MFEMQDVYVRNCECQNLPKYGMYNDNIYLDNIIRNLAETSMLFAQSDCIQDCLFGAFSQGQIRKPHLKKSQRDGKDERRGIINRYRMVAYYDITNDIFPFPAEDRLIN